VKNLNPLEIGAMPQPAGGPVRVPSLLMGGKSFILVSWSVSSRACSHPPDR